MPVADITSVTDEQLRTLVLDALESASQLVSLYSAVAGLAAHRQMTAQPILPRGGVGPQFSATGFGMDEVHLTAQDRGRVWSIICDLFVEGIVRPGDGAAETSWARYYVTKEGKEFLAGKSPSPFDPEGYLSQVEAISGVDQVIITYLRESLRTFRIRCYLASSVTLGAASEKSLLLLIDALAAAMPASDCDAFRKKVEPLGIKQALDQFFKVFDTRVRPILKGQKQHDLEYGLDDKLKGIANIIREQRNAAGHPEGRAIGQNEAHAALYIFPSFLRKVYGLITWLKTTTI